jgi:hypothetical protein
MYGESSIHWFDVDGVTLERQQIGQQLSEGQFHMGLLSYYITS